MAGRSRPKKMLAVDWDARTLRLVHASTRKRAVKIERVLSAAIPPDVDPDSPEQMGQYIRRTLDQEGISTRHAVVDIPRDQAILKTFNLPASQPDDLPRMVEIQIAKELPFPVGVAVIDFAKAPPLADSINADVLVAAIRSELLEQFEATCRAADLKLDRVGLRPHASGMAVCEFLKHAVPERVLFIDVRPTFMEIDVLKDSVLTFSRSASVTIPERGEDSGPVISLVRPPSDSQTLEPEGEGAHRAEEVASGEGPAPEEVPSAPRRGIVGSLVLEVTRSIEAYRAGDPGARIDHVVIGGDVGVEEALAAAIQKRLNITAELYNPASTFGWEPDEGAAAVAFAASLGLVLSYVDTHSDHFDFLHPKRVVSVTKQRLKKAPMVAAVALLFAAAGIVAFAQMTKPARERERSLTEQIRKMERGRRGNNEFLNLAAEIRSFDADQYVWVDVLYDIMSVFPTNEEMVISHMDMDQKGGEVTLKTRAKDRDLPTDVIRRLQEFRRPGRDKQRFRASMGPQSQKKQEQFPFFQDLRISVLNDEPARKDGDRPSRP